MAKRELDDIANRKKYKEEKFNGKRSMKDEYTGERIFYGNAKDAKYKHSSTADSDHVTSIEVVKKRYGDLKPEQQKKLANNEKYNYAMTDASLNRSKGGLENHEYLARKLKRAKTAYQSGEKDKAKQEIKEFTKQAPKMLSKEVKSRTGMAIEGNKYRVQNVSEKLTVWKRRTT